MSRYALQEEVFCCYMLKQGPKYVASYWHVDGTDYAVAVTGDLSRGLQVETESAAKHLLAQLPAGIKVVMVYDSGREEICPAAWPPLKGPR